MPEYGVTAHGFVPKDIDTILTEAAARARQVFGEVDLAPTSALTKILQVAADQDALLWRSLEDTYYSRFASTAIGSDLDRLGEDLGVTRRHRFATGEVAFTLANGQPARSYVLPEGTVVIAGTQSFHTTAAVTLTAAAPTATVAVQAFSAGPAGNVAPGAVTGIDPVYAQLYLTVTPPATVTVTNARAFTGGELQESDETLRARLIARPRTLWTPDSVRSEVLDVPGVLDVALSDPLGGVDVAQSYFGIFAFAQRLFSAQRRIGEPYFFDVVVAHEPAWPWRTTGAIPGIFDRVAAAVDRVRPVGIHPNIVQANHIRVGLRATVSIAPGLDALALIAACTRRLSQSIGALKLGGDVLFSQVMREITELPGVVDVQNLHLRRFPPEFGRITFGPVPFQAGPIESGPGENLPIGATEIALFEPDSPLIDLQVVDR
ncbi:baseplate J/gp47 family protein [Nocardia thraciensis]